MLRVPSSTSESAAADEPSAPEPRAAARGSTRSKPYQAQQGDTLYSLGRHYHVSPKALAELNGLSTTAHLHVGQTVRLPGQE